MRTAGQIAGLLRRRLIAAWLLSVFLLAQAVPVAALGTADSMSAMACCKKGKGSCCRRKPMQSPPSFRAPNPCGVPCCGVPAVPICGAVALAAPALAFSNLLDTARPLSVTPQEARVSAGVDPSQYQRPPPSLQA